MKFFGLLAVGVSAVSIRSLVLKLDGHDTDCKTGIRSLKVAAGKDGPADGQVCCPSYCKECTNDATCEATFGANTKDTGNACCASTVYKLFNEGQVKSCDESLPP